MKDKTTYRCYKIRISIQGLLMVLLVVAIACNSKKQDHKDHQVSSINLNKDVKKDSMPGMDMTTNDGGHELHNSRNNLNTIKDTFHIDSTQDEMYWSVLPTNQTVIARQQAVKPAFNDTGFLVTANGYITLDARRNRKVAVRVGGRIERLYVKYNNQYVHRGEKILELYSPELNTYVEEYLYIRRSGSDSILQKKAKEKLLLLGLSALQISQIDKTGSVSLTIPIYSPFEGYVLFNPSSSSASMENGGGVSGGMGSMNNSSNESSSIQASALSDKSIREGMYVSKDQTLFWINDFREVWGILAFSKDNEKYIHKGQVAIVESELLPDQSFRSTIQFTEPVYQQGQKFTQVRIYISNNNKRLKQNSLIKANVFVSASSMMLPASSVFYLGRLAIVWVQTGVTKESSNIFQSRVVRVGRKSDRSVEILEGLKKNELVAKDAAYLADSETIINY